MRRYMLTWVETHKELTNYIKGKENSQSELNDYEENLKGLFKESKELEKEIEGNLKGLKFL